jgi:translation elongation factor EF-Tu-like GTPase
MIHIRLRLLSTDDGGRRNPIAQGYRSSWDNGDRTDDGSTHFHDAPVVHLSVEWLAPGDEADAVSVPVMPDAWTNLEVGANLTAYEGGRSVAAAVVTKIEQQDAE